MTRIRVKICGITSPGDAALAANAGADYLGMIFFPPSPRSIPPDQAPEVLAAIPDGVARVALTVNPDDALIDALVPLGFDWLQLHGAEPPERVAELRERTDLSVMKAVGVREAADLAAIEWYAPVADQLLIDAKPPKGAEVPGGHGVAFDWTLIAGRTWPVAWMLAGGLTPENVAQAITLTGAEQVDVASGTESSPGIKDAQKVRAFVQAAKAEESGTVSFTGLSRA